MTVPRLLLVVGLAVVVYLIGARSGRHHYTPIRRGAQHAGNHPAAKKDRARLQKLASRSAKKISKAVHR